MDHHDFDPYAADPELCRQACLNDPTCKAFTHVKPGEQGPNPGCWLKNGTPAPTPNDCCISGLP